MRASEPAWSRGLVRLVVGPLHVDVETGSPLHVDVETWGRNWWSPLPLRAIFLMHMYTTLSLSLSLILHPTSYTHTHTTLFLSHPASYIQFPL